MVVKFQVELNNGFEEQSNPLQRSLKAPMSKACNDVGMLVGELVGVTVGWKEGLGEGRLVGCPVGADVGASVGATVG